MKYALYPGCAAQGATPELYQSTRAIIGRLGIEVIELAAAACCGAGVVTEAHPDMALALNARTFAQAETLGLDVMTICGTCQGVMSAANRRLKTEAGTLDRINALLAPEGLAYQGHVQVKHLLWIVVRDIGLARLGALVSDADAETSASPRFTAATSCVPRGIWGLTIPRIHNPSSVSSRPSVANLWLMPGEPNVADFPSSSKRKPLPSPWQGHI